jgi:hypothetical protein
MLELTVLIISISVILIVLYLKDNNIKRETNEGFQNYYLSSCPPGYKSFYNTDGNIICCDGNVVANKCLGDNQCTLNGKGTEGMPNCVNSILKMYTEKGKTQCPSSMSSYFEDRALNKKGCTSGRLNETLNGPQFSSQPVCVIYNDYNKNNTSKDSCANQKLVGNAECFGNNCTKELVQPIPSAPPLVAIGFTDNTGMHRVAYTKQSLESFLNITNPNWKNQGMDLSKNINVAEVAKAYYVDKTIDQSQIQL